MADNLILPLVEYFRQICPVFLDIEISKLDDYLDSSLDQFSDSLLRFSQTGDVSTVFAVYDRGQNDRGRFFDFVFDLCI